MLRFWANTFGAIVFVSLLSAPAFSTEVHVGKFCKRKSHAAKQVLPCTCTGVMIACTDCDDKKSPSKNTFPALEKDAEAQTCNGLDGKAEDKG